MWGWSGIDERSSESKVVEQGGSGNSVVEQWEENTVYLELGLPQVRVSCVPPPHKVLRQCPNCPMFHPPMSSCNSNIKSLTHLGYIGVKSVGVFTKLIMVCFRASIHHYL